MIIIDKQAEDHDAKILMEYINEQKRALGIPTTSPTIDTTRKSHSTINRLSMNTSVFQEERIQLKDIRNLSLPFWFSCLSCMFTYISVVNYVMIISAVL